MRRATVSTARKAHTDPHGPDPHAPDSHAPDPHAPDPHGAERLGPWRLGELTLTEHTALPDPLVGEFYRMYAESFGVLRVEAAARHVLSPSDFREEMADPRIWKYVAWDAEGLSLGLCTLTKDPDAVPWISPDFYRARFPEHAERDAIYYQGFSLVRPGHQRMRVFNRLAEVSAYRPRADRAVMGYDICAYNIDELQMDRRISSIARRHGAHDFEQVDPQTYLTMRFD